MKLQCLIATSIISCLLLSITIGCSSDTHASNEHDDDHHGHHHDHDHGDMPKTLHAAIVDLRQEWEEISDAVTQGNPEEAHDPLHEVGEILTGMLTLAADTDLSEDQWNELKKTIDSLMDAFGEIDAAFHEEKDKVEAYEAVKSVIEEGVNELEKVLPLLGEYVADDHHHDEEHDHDDDHEDHEHDHDHEE